MERARSAQRWETVDELDEPEAKASLIWIIGEYASKIDNADELLGIFVDTFTEESYPVGSNYRHSRLHVDKHFARYNYRH